MAMWTFEEPQEEAQARVEVELSAEPAAVFAALTDAALLSRWLGPSAEVDLREGGKYTFVFEDGLEVSGVYVIVERGVSFLASWEAPGVEESFLEVEIQRTRSGGTLKLTHRGLPTAAAAEAYGERWAAAAERLKRHLAGGA